MERKCRLHEDRQTPKGVNIFPNSSNFVHFLRFFRNSQQHGKIQITTTSDLILARIPNCALCSLYPQCPTNQRFIQQQKSFRNQLVFAHKDIFAQLTFIEISFCAYKKICLSSNLRSSRHYHLSHLRHFVNGKSVFLSTHCANKKIQIFHANL